MWIPGRRSRPVQHRADEAVGRSRGGLTTEIHLASDGACRPLSISSRRNRQYLRRRQIQHTIPERKDQRANRRRRGSQGGRPTRFDPLRDSRRNEVERTINRLKMFRAVATCFDKRAYVFHGTVTVAAVRLWLRARG